MAASMSECETGDKLKTNAKTSKDLLYSEKYPNARVSQRCLLSKKSKSKERPGRSFVIPESTVLDRVKALLPKMKAANEELLKQMAEDPDSVVLEVPEDSEAPHIAVECYLMEAMESDSSDSDSDDSEEDSSPSSVTEATLKLPGAKRKRSTPLVSEVESPPSKVQGVEKRQTRSTRSRRKDSQKD